MKRKMGDFMNERVLAVDDLIASVTEILNEEK
jgi:hypothetical protein